MTSKTISRRDFLKTVLIASGTVLAQACAPKLLKPGNMDIRISSSHLPVGVFQLKQYGDPWMMEKMGLDTDFVGVANFQNIALFTPQHGFQGVSTFQHVSYDYLESIQVADNCTVRQKMNWLTGTGCPYWWKEAEDYVFGTILFGGQLCQVECKGAAPVIYTFRARYQQEKGGKHPIDFYKLIGMQRSDMGKYTYEDHPWLIQKCTVAYRRPEENTYSDLTPTGTVYHPVWSPLDFHTNAGDGDELYIAKDFLVPVT
jgi:hypothetical protein